MNRFDADNTVSIHSLYSAIHSSKVYSTDSPSSSTELDQKIPNSESSAILAAVNVITASSLGAIRFTADGA